MNLGFEPLPPPRSRCSHQLRSAITASQASTTERYAHLADDPVRQAADAIGNRIAAALGGKSGEVVEMHRGKK